MATSNQETAKIPDARVGSVAESRKTRIYRAQGMMPLWGKAADKNLAMLLSGVINGVTISGYGRPTTMVDPVLRFAKEEFSTSDSASPALVNARDDVERWLHSNGRDREVLDLEQVWPGREYGATRVYAHLMLGDVTGAAQAFV